MVADRVGRLVTMGRPEMEWANCEHGMRFGERAQRGKAARRGSFKGVSDLLLVGDAEDAKERDDAEGSGRQREGRHCNVEGVVVVLELGQPSLQGLELGHLSLEGRDSRRSVSK